MLNFFFKRWFKTLVLLSLLYVVATSSQSCNYVTASDVYLNKGCLITTQGSAICTDERDALHIVPGISSFIRETNVLFDDQCVEIFLTRLAVHVYYYDESNLDNEGVREMYINPCGKAAGCIKPFGAIYEVYISKRTQAGQPFNSWMSTALQHELMHGVEFVCEGVTDYEHKLHPEHWSGIYPDRAKQDYCHRLGSMCHDLTN